MEKLPMRPILPREYERELESMSPFEVKNKLIELASDYAKKSTHILLNAGRGNPNWIATVPRKAFFLLGEFGIQECRRVMDLPEGIAGIPLRKGIAKRFEAFLKEEKHGEDRALLRKTYDYFVDEKKVDADELVHEWAEAVIGDQYPVPDRILKFNEIIVRDYLNQELGDRKPIKGAYDLFATEGGTAGMCYVFDSLQENFLVSEGDHIALMVPIFTPYIEIPELRRFSFKVTNINASVMTSDGYHLWQYPDSDIDKLKDPSIKVLFITNPSNPPSCAMSQHTLDRIVDIVKNDNPNLMIVTDDVYGTFVPHFRSLMYELPNNTICVYSYSKYFGATGWRLAVVAVHERNLFDKLIAALPDEKKSLLNKRYSSLSLQPERMKFIDRMVADSRMVALNHTSGLSTPQQMLMTLFSAMSLFDKGDVYKTKVQELIQKRLRSMWKNTGFKLVEDPLRAGYYSQIDLLVWAKKYYGDDFAEYIQKHYEPIDFVLRLAHDTGIVLLNGSGFDAPPWSIRASLANLNDEDYNKIGAGIRHMLTEYAAAWEAGKKK